MASNNVTVIGLQWGDEGKGKVVDALAAGCRYVARYCGGANAGHSVRVGDEKFALHLIPCGILHTGVMNVVANGLAFDPGTALEEISALQKRNIAVSDENLSISRAAHVVMPWHKLQDRLSEADLGNAKIGTTARGIGPCYADKASRTSAIRVGELTQPEQLAERIRTITAAKNKAFAALYDTDERLDAEAVTAEYVEHGRRLAPMIRNTGAMLRGAIARGERILFEGGQGSMLDVDHGTYPFVTSSPVTACGVPPGAGVPPASIGAIVGLVKAYSTRVGAGPFPTEQDNRIGEYIREHGREFGTTTGRPRRCGWLDTFAVRYAADLSGVDELALSLLDVLSGLDEIRICTDYRVETQIVEDFDPLLMDKAECVYETLPGWTEDISDCRTFAELPRHAQQYVERVETLIGRPVGLISVGPERAQTIRHNSKIQGLA